MGKDSDDFKEQMLSLGVKPMQPSRRHHELVIKSKTSSHGHQYAERRLAASGYASRNHLDSGGEIQWLGPNDVLEFRKPGVQHGLYRSLRQGRLEIGSSLDLHGFRTEQARKAVLDFIHDCSLQGHRCGLIVHGKGWHARSTEMSEEMLEGKARLKSHVNHWLREMPMVLAFCSAQAKDGGTGALYVLVKSGNDETIDES